MLASGLARSALEYCQATAEGEQSCPANDIDRDPSPESKRGATVENHEQRDQAKQPQRAEQR